MRASGRVLRRLAARRACAACEGWSRGAASALLAGEVGACARCRELSAIAGSPTWCTPHVNAGWQIYRAFDRHRLEAHGEVEALRSKPYESIPARAGEPGASP